jgi:hypothetical protein
MSDGALRQDVIEALARHATITHLPNGAIEIAKEGEMLRTYPAFSSVVPRGLLREFERYYGVPMAAFYPAAKTPIRLATKVEKDAG